MQELSLALSKSTKEFIDTKNSKKEAVANLGFEFTKTMGGASETQVKSVITRYIYG